MVFQMDLYGAMAIIANSKFITEKELSMVLNLQPGKVVDERHIKNAKTSGLTSTEFLHLITGHCCKKSR